MAVNQLNWFSLQSLDTKLGLSQEDLPALQRCQCGQLNSEPTDQKNDRGLIPPLEGRLPTSVNPADKRASEQTVVCTHHCPVVLSLFSADTEELVCACRISTD